MNPANTEEEIYDFEGNFERAVKGVLEARGILAHIMRENTDVKQNFVGAMLSIEEALEHLSKKPSGDREFDRYRANLQITVATMRDTDAPPETAAEAASSVVGLHRAWTAMIRTEFQLESKKPFDLDNLPFYAVQWLRPRASAFEGAEESGLDVSRINYEVVFDIRTEAWPAE